MSNTAIYSTNSGACQENPTKKHHYVYRITNLVDGKHYYGSRTSKLRPEEDLGKKYFSSSRDKEFLKDQKKNPENYRYKIIRVFDDRREALKLEIELHEKFNVGVNESFYNRMKQTSTGFDTTGKVSVRDKEGNFLTVSLTDERYLSGELVGATAGKVPVIDENGNTMVVDIDHEDYMSGKLKSISLRLGTRSS